MRKSQPLLTLIRVDDDLQAKYHNSLLGDVIKMANTLAIKESQLEQK